MLEMLTCQTCARPWWRTFRRGTKPHHCPPCRQVWANEWRHRTGYVPKSTARPSIPCVDCGVDVPMSYGPQGRWAHSKRCADCELAKKRLKWRRALCARHGITVEQYDRMMAQQGGVCAVPGCEMADDGRGRSLHIDHDHTCCPGEHSCGQCVRGLLCAKHNIGIGYFADSPSDLEAAASYLRSRRSLTAVA